jgi:hypothetical protein
MMEVGDGEVRDGFGVGGSAPRSGPAHRVTETDLAILTAFCRPYLEREGRFVVPAPNNEILRELSQNGIYLEIDALRGHLRNLYAKFGVEDGLNPAQKRARLAELVYEHGVIAGWEPRHAASEMPATAAPSHPAASVVPGAPEAPTASRRGGSLHDRPWVAAGVAVLLLGAVVLAGKVAGSGRSPAPVGPPEPNTIATDKKVILQKSKCQPGRFCLARLHNMSGGLYQGTVDDPDLSDDRFYYYGDPDRNKQMGPVTNQTWAAWNRGHRDVIVYDGPRGTGAGACSRRGLKINLSDRWRDRISSFRFASRSVCNRYDVLADAGG